MDRLANMIAFVTVAETGSFAETASRLNLANSVVSKRIKDLEDYLGAQLLQRTTRTLSLTEAGHAYADHARKFLDELAEVEENLRYRNDNPVGEIRVGAPMAFGNMFLGSAVSSFLEKYPDATVRLLLNDKKEDLAAGTVDVILRAAGVADPDIAVRRIARSRRVVVASPAYLEKHGRPQAPHELSRHNCLCSSTLGDGKVWPFLKRGRVALRQHVGGRFVSNSSALLGAAAVRGDGLACLPTFIVGPHVMSGELEIVLQDYETEPMAIEAAYRRRPRPSVRIEKFVAHLAEHFKGFGG